MDGYYGSYNGEIMQAIRPYLMDGEEVLWCGKPNVDKGYRPQWFLLIFAIFWLGFSIFWMVGASLGGGFFGLFGLPFVAVGIYLLYTVLFGTKSAMKRTVYAVTDTRALVIAPRFRHTVCAQYVFRSLSTAMLEMTGDNIGNIHFMPMMPFVSSYNGSSVRVNDSTGSSDAFFAVDNVQSVYQIISEKLNGNQVNG